MKVIRSFAASGIEDAPAMVDATMAAPIAGVQDVVVNVVAVSVNPVDTKLRQNVTDPAGKVFGYDAVGTIAQVGQDVTDFKVGDRVFYAGTTKRDGANAEQQVVDARLIAKAPATLSDAEAAAMPLTSLSAGEVLFEKMGFLFGEGANEGRELLIVNGAGGVGSMAIQLAKWAGLTVTATASRPETIAWVKQLGADRVFNHREDLIAQAKAAAVDAFDGILILHSTDQYFAAAAQLVTAFGHVASIVENVSPLPMGLLKNKAASFDWEYMFAKSDYAVDMAGQGVLLADIAKLVDAGVIKTTLTKTLADGINADSLRAAHQLVEANKMIGKVVVTGPFNGNVNDQGDK
ncbi:zinc-binding alcohol dehydrogenase family protein [Furfurilactobacillus siliginis]|nr:zinc-binding alcohol dehydrogenase family protein [Furfurilactobacillus siliginis]GEK27824.1 NADPH:quinone reductase [Furfurilactobacillus siliginis]